MTVQTIRVESETELAIEEFVAIRERDLVKNRGYFIAEGRVVLSMLLDAHLGGTDFRLRKILILENRLNGILPLLKRVPHNVPIYVAKRSILDKIAGFDMHRGVLAIGEKHRSSDMNGYLDALPPQALILALMDISNHDNVGALFRNAAAFGVDLILLDERCADPLYRKAIRVSVGAALHVPFARAQSQSMLLSALSQRNFSIWGFSPAGQTELRAIPTAPRIALICGAEGDGLPETILEKIQTARIAQRPTLDSLNVATAMGIALYDIASRHPKT